MVYLWYVLSIGELSSSILIQFTGTGDPDLCTTYVRQLFDKNCTEWGTCTFNNVYQPPAGDANFVALDGLARVVNFYSLPDAPVLNSLKDSANQFCSTSYFDAVAEYNDRPLDGMFLSQYCFEGIYAYQLLTYGLNFPPSSSQILFIDYYFGIEVSWALGAMADQVSSTLAN